MAASYSKANLATAENCVILATAAGFIIGIWFMFRIANYYRRHYGNHPRRNPAQPLFFGMGCMFALTVTLQLSVEALLHTYFDVLPNTCDAMIELRGPGKAAEMSYPCQRDMLVSWFNKATTTGHMNLGQLLEIDSVDFLLWPLLVFSGAFAFVTAIDLVFQWRMDRPVRLGDEKEMRELEAQKSVWGVCPHCSHGFVVSSEDDI